MNLIQKEVEKCDSLSGFFIIMSMAGGTGSGLGAFITQNLQDQYSSALKMNRIIWPYGTGEVWTHQFKNFCFVVFAIKTNIRKRSISSFLWKCEVIVSGVSIQYGTLMNNSFNFVQTLPSKWGVLIYKNSKEENCSFSQKPIPGSVPLATACKAGTLTSSCYCQPSKNFHFFPLRGHFYVSQFAVDQPSRRNNKTEMK